MFIERIIFSNSSRSVTDLFSGRPGGKLDKDNLLFLLNIYTKAIFIL